MSTDLRSRPRPAVIALVIGIVAVLLFKWLTTATPVTKRQALEAFEKHKAATAAGIGTPAPAGVDAVAGGPGSAAGGAESGGPAAEAARPGGKNPAGRPAGDTSPGVLTRPDTVVPPEGVYAYETAGGESMSLYPGDFRSFPETTYRDVVHIGPDSWTEHHAFIKERQMWTDMRAGATGNAMEETRQIVQFGAYDFGETMAFKPAIPLFRLPWEAGGTWKGNWTNVSDNGETSGVYEGGTRHHEQLAVEGQTVGVWVDDLAMSFRGRIEGSVTVRRWTSPQHGLVIREQITTEAKRGGISYRSHWDVQLKSLRPTTR